LQLFAVSFIIKLFIIKHRLKKDALSVIFYLTRQQGEHIGSGERRNAP